MCCLQGFCIYLINKLVAVSINHLNVCTIRISVLSTEHVGYVVHLHDIIITLNTAELGAFLRIKWILRKRRCFQAEQERQQIPVLVRWWHQMNTSRRKRINLTKDGNISYHLELLQGKFTESNKGTLNLVFIIRLS